MGKENPIPLRKSEVDRILGKVDEMQDSGETMTEPFLVGELVKIIDGPFNDFIGNIEEIYDEKKKIKVIVKIFGRRTPVELNFVQVENKYKKMAKEIETYVKLNVKGGQANPSPPIGPALGSKA